MAKNEISIRDYVNFMNYVMHLKVCEKDLQNALVVIWFDICICIFSHLFILRTHKFENWMMISLRAFLSVFVFNITTVSAKQ